MNNRIQNLDPLRGLLAIIVVLYHIPLISETVNLPYYASASVFNRGPEAVLVFFSLSGYLIIGRLYEEKQKMGKINIKNFYLRRILRLYPVYYIVLFFGFIFYHYLLPFFNIDYQINYNLIEGIILSVVFLPNVFRAMYEPGSILIILWSIGIEEQFYLLVAPILALIPIRKYLKYLLMFSLIYFIIYHLEYFYFLEKFYMVFFFMSLGGVFAIAQKKGIKMHFRFMLSRIILYIISIFYFTTGLFLFEEKIYTNSFQLILFSLLVVNLANDPKLQIKTKWLNYLGKISYGIYMYHMIVINFIVFIFLQFNLENHFSNIATILMINLFSFAGTIIVAHASYFYIELYFLKRKKKLHFLKAIKS